MAGKVQNSKIIAIAVNGVLDIASSRVYLRIVQFNMTSSKPLSSSPDSYIS